MFRLKRFQRFAAPVARTVSASLVLMLVLTSAPIPAIHAQDNAITITIAVPSFGGDIKATIKDFETSHPGIHVQVITKDAQIPNPASGLDAYFKAVADYVSSADVIS